MRPLYFRVQRFFCVLVQLAQTYMQDTFAGIDCSLLMIYSVNNIISIRDRDEAMRVEIEYIDNEEEHVVVYCKEKDEKVQLIINYVESMNLTMKGTFQDEIKLFFDKPRKYCGFKTLCKKTQESITGGVNE